MRQQFNFAVSLLAKTTGELLNVRKQHISFSVQSGVAVLTLGFMKGGVTLTHEVAVGFLRQWLHISHEGQGFCWSATRWRTLFADGTRDLQLQTFEFRPYSLRRGGATWYVSKFGSLDRVMHGSMASSSNCSHIFE